MLLIVVSGKWNPAISNVTSGWTNLKHYHGKGTLEEYILMSFQGKPTHV